MFANLVDFHFQICCSWVHAESNDINLIINRIGEHEERRRIKNKSKNLTPVNVLIRDVFHPLVKRVNIIRPTLI